jgi:hypothetical protein
MSIIRLIILLLLIGIVFYLTNRKQKKQKGGSYRLAGNAPFSLVDDYIGKGIKGSYANIINGPDETKQKLNPTEKPRMTFYGHSIPLVPQEPGKFWGIPMTPHHKNPKCAPECCPSPYSCDKGCLCVDIDGLRNTNTGSYKFSEDKDASTNTNRSFEKGKM